VTGIGESELTSAGRGGVTLDGLAGGVQRTIDAAVLRRCCRELREQIDPRGLRLANAIVTGCLDLTGLVVPFSLRWSCSAAAPSKAGCSSPAGRSPAPPLARLSRSP